jgi:hypothetical protein
MGLPVFLGTLALGCHGGGPPRAAPSAIPIPPLPPASSPPVARAPEPPPSVRVVRLPDQPYDAAAPGRRTVDAAPGAPPSFAFPAGTVYVATGDARTTAPVSVTEWDLDREIAIRSVAFSGYPDEREPWMVRAGERLRILLAGPHSITFTQLPEDLRPQASKELRFDGSFEWATRVDPPGITAFSADSKLTAVLYSGASAIVSTAMEPGIVLTTFDASGKLVATRLVQRAGKAGSFAPSKGMERNAVVLGGRAFVALCGQDTGTEVLSLKRSLAVDGRVLLSREPDCTAELRTRDGHLLVLLGSSTRAMELSAGLDVIGPTTVPADPQGFRLGDEEVRLCTHRERAWLAWTTDHEDPCAASPSYLRGDPRAGVVP